MVVFRNELASLPADVKVQEYAPGVFTYQRAPGVFDPIVIGANGSLVSPDNPAHPGDVLVVYATGLGDLTATPPTGDLVPLSPLTRSQGLPAITLGGAPVEVQFSGLTALSIGLAQFNIKLPGSLPPGSTLPLVIRFGSVSSPPVNLAVAQR